MKKGIFILMVLSLLCSFALAENAAFAPITDEEILQRVQTQASFEFIDTRDAEAFDLAHIPHALNISDESMLADYPQTHADLSSDIYVYGDDAVLNETIARGLASRGYTSVFVLGEFANWHYVTYSTEEQVKRSRVMGFFEAQDIGGNTVTETAFEGHRLSMINIWATYCNPCLAEMPDLGAIDKALSDQGFQVIGIVTDIQDGSLNVVEDQLALAKEIIEQTGADYLHLVPSEDLIYAFLNQVTAVPCTFFVDDQGDMVGSVYFGAKSHDEWMNIITPLLEEVQSDAP